MEPSAIAQCSLPIAVAIICVFLRESSSPAKDPASADTVEAISLVGPESRDESN